LRPFGGKGRSEMKKKVLFISKKDFAGSGVKLCDALNNHSNSYTSRFIAHKPANFGAKNDIVTSNEYVIQKHINNADIIHLKGDFPISHFTKLDFTNKPIFQTVGGSYFRRQSDKHIGAVALAKYNLNEYTCFNLSGITPELTENWIPHAIDIMPNYWTEPKGRIRIGHAPSHRGKKGTENILEALKSFDVDVVLMENLTNKEVIEIKKTLHLFIDQSIIEAYGMNAVECLAMGVPVISSCKKLKGSPIEVIEANSVESIKTAIQRALNRLNNQWSEDSHEWAKNTHSYKSVCEKLESFYSLKPTFYNMEKVSLKTKIVIQQEVAGMKIGQVKEVKKSIAKTLVNRCIAIYQEDTKEVELPNFDDMNKKELVAFAKGNNIEVNERSKVGEIREELKIKML
jgi:glycosyltransferase involved in cell wall biosynthesis